MNVPNIRTKTYFRSFWSENCIIGHYAKQIRSHSKLSNLDKNHWKKMTFWWTFQPFRRRWQVCHPIRRWNLNWSLRSGINSGINSGFNSGTYFQGLQMCFNSTEDLFDPILASHKIFKADWTYIWTQCSD